jgi:succinate-acetate transporter protein
MILTSLLFVKREECYTYACHSAMGSVWTSWDAAVVLARVAR